ncbi:hypothetical protein QBC34DRAFT_150748 [Podospora aff. communis PSN243]|uniref:Uncharacterized protein n=1 Tax=Podospora aff. communis PSN243 TaxID=3040156 RepID=A0AAV9GFS7_9PEZI|nr:hypothetical protein QBC34DRAFT_150748 [Podospora aff. communis PSN243]
MVSFLIHGRPMAERNKSHKRHKARRCIRMKHHGGSPDQWGALFGEEKVQSYPQQDVPFWYVNTSLDTTISPAPEPIAGPPTSMEMFELLMSQWHPQHEPHFYQEMVRRFCLEADMTILSNGGDDRVTRPVALLDDRNRGTGADERRGNYRKWKGALSAHQLYHELRKRRFMESPLSQNRGYRLPEQEMSEANAERRILYVADPDSWATLAVVATAPRNQAAYLGEFLFRYFTSKAFFHINMPSGVGFNTYALEFHLPFYALKSYTAPITDKRLRADGRPLRDSWYQPFLTSDSTDAKSGWRPEGPHDAMISIHEGSVSVIITGFDPRSWCGVGFVDAYYNGDSPSNPEAVTNIAQCFTTSADGERRPIWDPLGLCEVYADTPLWRPQQYFPRILELHVRQVRLKWQDVAEYILQRTEPYFHPTSSIYPSDAMAPNDPERHASFRSIQGSITRTLKLMDNVVARITKTTDAWNSFREHLAEITTASGHQEYPNMLFRKVDTHMTNLTAMCGEISVQRQRLENLWKQIYSKTTSPSRQIRNKPENERMDWQLLQSSLHPLDS